MTADLGSAEYAFLIILKAEGREISNTEMDRLYRVRLVSPNFEKLNAAGYVTSVTKRGTAHRHTITADGLKVLTGPLSVDDDSLGPREKRSPGERQLWAAVVAQQNELVRSPARTNGAARPPADLDGRIRAAYDELAGGQGEWVDLTALRPLLGDAPKAEVDRALVRMLDSPDVRLEPEPFGHRIGPEQRRAAVHIGGEDRHKLAIGMR